MLKKKICDKVREFLSTISLPAVIYAENLVGKGFGDTTKEIAIDFILQKLPSFLLPFKGVIKKLLLDILDFAVEMAVKKLHSIQQKLPEVL